VIYTLINLKNLLKTTYLFAVVFTLSFSVAQNHQVRLDTHHTSLLLWLERGHVDA
jgi:hypothetical protein